MFGLQPKIDGRGLKPKRGMGVYKSVFMGSNPSDRYPVILLDLPSFENEAHDSQDAHNSTLKITTHIICVIMINYV